VAAWGLVPLSRDGPPSRLFPPWLGVVTAQKPPSQASPPPAGWPGGRADPSPAGPAWSLGARRRRQPAGAFLHSGRCLGSGLSRPESGRPAPPTLALFPDQQSGEGAGAASRSPHPPRCIAYPQCLRFGRGRADPGTWAGGALTWLREAPTCGAPRERGLRSERVADGPGGCGGQLGPDVPGLLGGTCATWTCDGPWSLWAETAFSDPSPSPPSISVFPFLHIAWVAERDCHRLLMLWGKK
jgi:hypothetical protein